MTTITTERTPEVRTRPYDHVKRACDVVGASLALVALSPLIAVIALVIALRLGRPVLFRQPRPGRHGQTFTILKFRSMLEVDESRGIVTDAERLTRFGRALRASSLDELPNLVNVLRGEMSIVGPRPSLVRYLELYSDEQNRRHDALPGLTGLAQVRGRNALPWEARLRTDVEYVDTYGPWRDTTILLRTVLVVLRRDGATTPGLATSSEFTGTASSSTSTNQVPA